MAAPIAFESISEKERKKEDRRKERERILEAAKSEYEKKERRKEKARQLGEGTWMLPSVDDRIKKEEDDLSNTLSSKHSKKHKKDKKSKKKKRKHRASSSDSDSSDADGELVWEEKSVTSSVPAAAKVMGPKLERDAWMTSEVDLFLSSSRTEKRKNAKAEERQAEADELERIKNQRELNPYWKNGGTGLPSEESDHNPPAPTTGTSRAFDGGLSWWQKAYKRCTELAEEEGRPLEEIAAERYGSLSALEKKLKDAEENERLARLERKGGDRKNHLEEYTSRFRRPGDSNERRPTSSFRRPDDDDDHYRPSSSDRCSDARDSSASRYRSYGHHEKSSCAWRKKDATSENTRHFESEKVGRQRDEETERESKSEVHSRRSDTTVTQEQKDLRNEEKGQNKEKENARSRVSSSSDSASSSDSEESNGVNDKPTKVCASSNKSEEPVRILTEQEMNQLGAKIVKAELMGDEDRARELKAQLEAARHAKASQSVTKPSNKPSTSVRHSNEEEVVLSRTDRQGMVRPLPDRQHPVEPKHGRRKKQKVSTHGRSGERERYFDDDDSYSLKSLVEREKLSTAEDQNHMFARLAGHGLGRTDDDFQVDDGLLERAATKQSQSYIENRERQLAVIEHKKMSASLDKCQYCFSNVPKHLIAAIGIKVFLMVPSHKSMNDGHCLIVPMHHVTQSTVVDEDVWDEIKIFRKGLTRMFTDSDEDCVFMETSMNLKRFPHMVIECVPLPKETGDMAPIYFKKAIQECETEWSDNKKLVDLSKKDIRNAVPKGFPYFSVDFGMQGGFAHVIENEKLFPAYFGREVVGGMLDLEPTLWRKPHHERFEEQREKVLKFADMWKPYDWTQRLKDSTETSA